MSGRFVRSNGHGQRLRTYFRKAGLDRWEADFDVTAFGLWVRVYAGTSNFPRPRVHYWRAYDGKGITVRRSSAMPGRGGCRVFGVQWRHAR